MTSSPCTPTADAELATTLRSAVTRLVRRLRAERPPHGLTMTQISALFALANNAPLTPGALAEHERVQPPAMTRTVAALEERGLVQRSPHPTDRRLVILTPTEAGTRLVAADRAQREAWLAARLTELSPEDRAVLTAATDVLARLARS